MKLTLSNSDIVDRFIAIQYPGQAVIMRIDVSNLGGPVDGEFICILESGQYVEVNRELILKAAELDEELKRLIIIWELSDE